MDANILIYARRAESPHHTKAEALLRELAEGARPWALPWPCVYSFLRVMTHPTIFRTPTPLAEAWQEMKSLLESPSVRVLTETDRHAAVLGGILDRTGPRGNLVHDAQIAALLEEHGVDEILTADDDFHRFPSLKVTNPFRQ